MTPYHAKLTPEQRLTNVGMMGMPLLTVYASPAKAQADIRSLCMTIAALREEIGGLNRRLRQIANAGDAISADVSAVLHRYSLLLKSPEAKE